MYWSFLNSQIRAFYLFGHEDPYKYYKQLKEITDNSTPFLFRYDFHCGMYIPLSDDKHQMVRDSSKKRTGQHGRNSNPVAMLPHTTVVFCMEPFNYCCTNANHA